MLRIRSSGSRLPRLVMQRSAAGVKAAATTALTPAPSPTGVPLLGRTVAELEELVQTLGFKREYGQKLHASLLQKAPFSLDELKGQVSHELRRALVNSGECNIGRSTSVLHDTTASDGTQKLVLRLQDGSAVECVGIPAHVRRHARQPEKLTACLSVMAGCPLACSFCATGMQGFGRVLRASEIVDQVLTLQERTGKQVSAITYMGQGDPALALSSVERSVEAFAKGLQIGRKRITISTVGVPGRIERLAHYHLGCTLTISLHASNQQVRERLIPSARSYPLEQLLSECAKYKSITSRPPCFEYLLISGENDQLEHAHELCDLLQQHGLPYHVNLIEWNEVPGIPFKSPYREHTRAFQKVVRSYGIPCTLRYSAGQDEAAACGQLRNTMSQ